MEAISVYPSSKAEASFIKEFLKRVKVPFEETHEELKDWQKAEIEAGARDIATGRVSPFDEAMKRIEDSLWARK